MTLIGMQLRVPRVAAALLALALLVAPAAAQDWTIDRPPGSQEVVDRYLEVLESDPESPQALDGLIREYVPRGGIEALIDELARRLAESPEDAGLHVVLARLRERASQLQPALVLVDRAIALGYETSGAYVFRGRLRGGLGAPEQAVDDFAQALALARGDRERVAILQSLGDLQMSLGRTDLALESYRRIGEVAPRDRYLRQELAQILYDAGLRAEALEQLREVVELSGTNTRDRADAMRAVGTLQEELGRYEEAIETWEDVRRITRADSWLHREAEDGIIRAYRSWGRLEQHLAGLESRLTARTRDPYILYTRARILAELGRIDEAVEAYRLAIERRPGDRDFAFELASYLIAIERQDEARAVLERLVEEHDGDIELVLALAELLVSMDLDFDASFLLRQRQERWWSSATELWDLFRIYQRIGDQSAADRVAARILDLAPDDLRPLLGVADVAFREGRADEALAVLEGVRGSSDPEIQLEMIDLVRQHGQLGLAVELVQEARERFPEDERVGLAWMRQRQSEGTDVALEAARELLLSADDWDVVAEAFDFYRALLSDAGLLDWGARHYGEVYDRDPSDHRVGRLALMFAIVGGHTSQATRLLSSLRAVTPPSVYPDEWVLASLRRWPAPEALPLLRRLSDSDPAGRWRYELIGAQLLVEAGRIGEARDRLDAIRREWGDRPNVVYETAQLLLSLHSISDRQLGCFLVDVALSSEPQNARFRLGLIECLHQLGKSNAAFEVAVSGFQVVREVTVAEALFDRLTTVMPLGVTREQVAEQLRETMRDASAVLREWLEGRLERWNGG